MQRFTDSCNSYFIDITKTLTLESMPKYKLLSDILKLYEDHFSVLKIKEKYKIKK